MTLITGIGIVCAIGKNTEEVLENIKKSKCGIGKIDLLDLSTLSADIGGEVKDLKGLEGEDRMFTLARLSFMEALEKSGINFKEIPPERIGLVFGTCNGNVLTIEEFYHTKKTDDIKNVIYGSYLGLSFLKEFCDIKGPKVTFATACASSNNAIGYGHDLIKDGVCDAVIVIGADSLSLSTFAGFNALDALSNIQASPFSSKIGLSLGEGAGCMILEAENASSVKRARAKVLGYGFNGESYHPTSPNPSGEGVKLCMDMALQNAGVLPSDIDFVIAHGTGTEANDKAESKAIGELFLENTFITSTKSLYGHTLGAAGITQSIIGVLSLKEEIIPPILHFEEKREGCNLNYVQNNCISHKSQVFASNSFAFGGNNVTTIFSIPNYEVKKITAPSKRRVVITGFGFELPNLEQNEKFIKHSGFNLSNINFRKFKKAPKIMQFAISATEKCLNNAKLSEAEIEKCGLLWGVSRGSLKVFEDFYLQALESGICYASALGFQYVVPNAIAGCVSLCFKMKGMNSTLLGQFSPLSALSYGFNLIKNGRAERFIIGGGDEISLADETLMRDEAFKNLSFAEGSATMCIESLEVAKKRNANIICEIESASVNGKVSNTSLSMKNISPLLDSASAISLIYDEAQDLKDNAKSVSIAITDIANINYYMEIKKYDNI